MQFRVFVYAVRTWLIQLCLIQIGLGLAFARSTFAAGGNTLGNGGGVAELLVTQAWTQLDTKVTVCFAPTNPCELNNRDLKDLASVVRLRQTSQPDLKFANEDSRQIFTHAANGDVTFNSRTLYENEKVKPFQTLFAYAIASFFTRLDRPYEESLEFGIRVTRFWKQALFSRQGVLGGKPVELTLLKVTGPTDMSMYVFAEYKANAWNLSEAFRQAFPCVVDISSLQILTGVFQSQGSEMSVSGQLQFQCKDLSRMWRGNYLIEVDSETHGAIVDISNIH